MFRVNFNETLKGVGNLVYYGEWFSLFYFSMVGG
jgi:hypothetical protein